MKAITYIKSAALLAAMLVAPAQIAFADGNAEQGAVIGYSCLGCHGIDGYRNAYPSYRVPKLGGQKREYIEGGLMAYRDGKRKHPTMQAQGGSLSETDINDVAAWLEGYGEVADAATADSAAGTDAATTCLQCHGKDAAAVVPTPATLSGQHADYLMHALNQYKNGTRSGTVMSAFASTLSDDDIEAVAKYFSSLPGLFTTKVDGE